MNGWPSLKAIVIAFLVGALVYTWAIRTDDSTTPTPKPRSMATSTSHAGATGPSGLLRLS